MTESAYSQTRDGDQSLLGHSLRLPPTNLAAEQALLGAILANNAAFGRVAGFLRPEHFADPINGRIYRESARLILRGQLVDAVTLAGVFEQSGLLADVGGSAYFARLLAAMVGIINAGEYGRTVHDAWLRRQLIEIGEVMLNNAFGAEPELDGEAQISLSTEQLMELSSKGAKDAPVMTIGDAARLAVRNAEAELRGEVTGTLRTGFPPLDNAIGALRAGWLYVLGGRPGQGKSSLALQASIGSARQLRREEDAAPPFSGAGGVVAFFSAEMPPEQVGGWAACHIGGVANDFLLGERQMTTAEAGQYLAAQRELDVLPIDLIDAVGMSAPAIVLRARAIHQKRRVRLVVIDHIQKLVSSVEDVSGGRRQVDRTGDTSRITSLLKDLARKLDCPVIALAQLKRDVDQRDSPRPRLSDLMHAGEADADVALFMFREELYLSRSPPERFNRETDEQYAKRREAWHRKWDEVRGRAELLVEKRRQGPLSSTRIGFSGPTTSFFELGASTAIDESSGLWDDV